MNKMNCEVYLQDGQLLLVFGSNLEAELHDYLVDYPSVRVCSVGQYDNAYAVDLIGAPTEEEMEEQYQAIRG
jgi:hypothetical protein